MMYNNKATALGERKDWGLLWWEAGEEAGEEGWCSLAELARMICGRCPAQTAAVESKQRPIGQACYCPFQTLAASGLAVADSISFQSETHLDLWQLQSTF